jgi:hypothetical protein
MDESADVAQARQLLAALHEQVCEISVKLDAAEDRNQRARARGTAYNHRHAANLRRELKHAHRLIDGIHRRFPGIHIVVNCQRANAFGPACRHSVAGAGRVR